MNSKFKIFVMLSSLILFPLISVMPQDVSLNFAHIEWQYKQAAEKVSNLEAKLKTALKEQADAKAAQSKNVIVSSYQVGGSSGENPQTENLKQADAKVIQLRKELALVIKEKADAEKALRKSKDVIKLNK